MALQFASAALIRMVTEKVMDAVMQKIAEYQRQAVENAQARGESTIDVTAVVALNMEITRLSEQISDLKGEIAGLRHRTDEVEKRYGWRLLLKIVFAMVVTIVFGFALGWLAHLGGWF